MTDAAVAAVCELEALLEIATTVVAAVLAVAAAAPAAVFAVAVH